MLGGTRVLNCIIFKSVLSRNCITFSLWVFGVGLDGCSRLPWFFLSVSVPMDFNYVLFSWKNCFFVHLRLSNTLQFFLYFRFIGGRSGTLAVWCRYALILICRQYSTRCQSGSPIFLFSFGIVLALPTLFHGLLFSIPFDF